MIVNRTELADLFGVHVTTVDQWTRKGCPVAQRGSKGVAWQFDSAAVSKWRLDEARSESRQDMPDDVELLDRRKQAAITGKHELELAKARALVAPIDQMERAVANAFAKLKINLRNIPGRVVVSLIGETDERRFKEVLLSEIDQALNVLSEMDLAGSEESEDEEENNDEAAA